MEQNGWQLPFDYLSNRHTLFGHVCFYSYFTFSNGLLNVTVFCSSKLSLSIFNTHIHNRIILHDLHDDPEGIYIPSRVLKMFSCNEDLDVNSPPRIENKGENGARIDRAATKEVCTSIQLFTRHGSFCRPPGAHEENLEKIFSQFGESLPCEVDHDLKTGNSLQYGLFESDWIDNWGERPEDLSKLFSMTAVFTLSFTRPLRVRAMNIQDAKWRNHRLHLPTTKFTPDKEKMTQGLLG